MNDSSNRSNPSISNQSILTDMHFEEEEENNELKLSDNIIDNISVDPFLPPSEITFDSNLIDSNASAENEPKLGLNSDLLFQSSIILNSNVDIKSDSSNNSGSLTQIKLSSFINDSTFINDNNSISQYYSIQEASKEQKYSSPNISIDSYFRDLIGRDINGPNLPSKEEILAYVEPYSIEQFAQSHFRMHSSFLFKSFETIEQITSFSDKPLSKPLLKKIDSSKKGIVQKLSTAILSYINVINVDNTKDPKCEEVKIKHDKLLLFIVKILREDNELIDECFMQLIKEMRNSPSKHILLLTWKIFITVSYMFYIKDQEILNVIHWFLINKMDSEPKESCAAYYSFICIHDRSILARNCKESRKTIVAQIAYAAFCGRQMFMCSLYEQMWHQKNKHPNLPIPLMLHLVIKALIKNGVFLTPDPFPSLDGNLTKHIKKKDQNSTKSNAINDASVNHEIQGKGDLDSNHKNNDSENHIIDNNENNGNNFGEMNEYKKNMETKKQRIHYYNKDRMEIIYDWINELPMDNEVLNNGEVCDLITLLLEWLSNLVDPIIPKNTLYDFMETFGNDDNASSLDKCSEFVERLPLLHINTLKYLIGFLRDIAKNEKWTHQSYQIIANNTGSFFVDTKFATVDPFTMKAVCDVAPRFVLYCLENLDVKAVYPLNPAYEIIKNV